MPPSTRQQADLPPFYYRDNFHQLLDTVEDQYGDLLTPPEHAFIEAYRGLGFDAQCLYVRLISRVGPWFRESRLSYPELSAIAPAVDELLSSGLAEQARGLCAQELGGLCSVAELSSLFSLRAGDKASLLQQVERAYDDPEGNLAIVQAADAGRVIAPSQQHMVNTAQLLFFGNRRQGLTDFVLSDLGVARYYPYRLDRSRRLFLSREMLEDYLACAALEDEWYALLESNDTAGMRELAGRIAPRRNALQQRWDRLYNRVARQLERLEEDQLALALYDHSQRHPARERSARLLEKAGEYAQARALCECIEQQPWCEDELDAARRILPRLQRKMDGTRVARQRDQFLEFSLQLPRGKKRVERLAADALSDDWQQVVYVENTLMNGLFGLAFWEQIFAGVPGAFNNPYQALPADMYEQGFVASRQTLIDARLDTLSTVALGPELTDCWRRYRGFQCRWVNWRALDEELVAAAAAVIPREHLLAIWRRMLFDPRENRRGFPDLLALGAAPGDYQMIEVKGPGDALQNSQKRWLRFFSDQQIPAAVAHVRWTDD